VAVILLFLVLKLVLMGYVAFEERIFARFSFLDQAVAQEEPMEEVMEAPGPAADGEQELISLSLLDKKSKELESRERKLKQEEDRLNQLKAEIENILESLTQREAGIDKSIKELITLRETLEEQELKKLAQVFESTPPEQAGPMFDKFDVRLAAKILFRMKGRYAGKIWGFVDPDQAVRISEELSTMKK
jgi:flagellar motility protein MotE (MotC chaperone)